MWKTDYLFNKKKFLPFFLLQYLNILVLKKPTEHFKMNLDIPNLTFEYNEIERLVGSSICYIIHTCMYLVEVVSKVDFLSHFKLESLTFAVHPN